MEWDPLGSAVSISRNGIGQFSKVEPRKNNPPPNLALFNERDHGREVAHFLTSVTMQFHRFLLSKHSVSLGSPTAKLQKATILAPSAMSQHNSNAESRVYMKRMAAFTRKPPYV